MSPAGAEDGPSAAFHRHHRRSMAVRAPGWPCWALRWSRRCGRRAGACGALVRRCGGKIARDMDGELRTDRAPRERWARRARRAPRCAGDRGRRAGPIRNCASCAPLRQTGAARCTLSTDERADRAAADAEAAPRAGRAATTSPASRRTARCSAPPARSNMSPACSLRAAAATVDHDPQAGVDGSGVGIAVLDSGVMRSHHDFGSAGDA